MTEGARELGVLLEELRADYKKLVAQTDEVTETMLALAKSAAPQSEIQAQQALLEDLSQKMAENMHEQGAILHRLAH